MAGVLESKSACCQKPRGEPAAQKLTVLAPTTTTPASHARRPKPACGWCASQSCGAGSGGECVVGAGVKDHKAKQNKGHAAASLCSCSASALESKEAAIPQAPLRPKPHPPLVAPSTPNTPTEAQAKVWASSGQGRPVVPCSPRLRKMPRQRAHSSPCFSRDQCLSAPPAFFLQGPQNIRKTITAVGSLYHPV